MVSKLACSDNLDSTRSKFMVWCSFIVGSVGLVVLLELGCGAGVACS
jgi:hypothetical protein